MSFASVQTWRPQVSHKGVLGVVLKYILGHPHEKEVRIGPGALITLKQQLKGVIHHTEIGDDYVVLLGVRITKL